MTIEQAYIKSILGRIAMTKRQIIEAEIRANTFARRLRNESPSPLNRAHALRGCRSTNKVVYLFPILDGR
jgi:hypothetical protein